MAELTVTAEPNSQNITSIVTVRASRDKVFAAHTNAEQIAKWWSGGQEMTVDYFDVTTGGKWRFLTNGLDGNTTHNFRGSFHSVDAPSNVIMTFEWEGMLGHISVDNSVFEEIEPGVTRITINSTFQSVEDRDGMVKSGMEAGYRQSIEALGKLIEK